MYSSLLSAVTRVHLAGDDEERLAASRLELVDIVNKMNILAGKEILLSVNTLLELQNKAPGSIPDLKKEYMILQQLVYSMRAEINPRELVDMKKEGFRFRFYLPSLTTGNDIVSNSEKKNRA